MDARIAEPIVVVDCRNAPIVGARLRWKRYRKWTGVAAPTSCIACGERFTEGGEPGLTSGYAIVGGGPAGQDDYQWICAICYEGLREGFGWVVLDTLGRPVRPSVSVEVRLRLRGSGRVTRRAGYSWLMIFSIALTGILVRCET